MTDTVHVVWLHDDDHSPGGQLRGVYSTGQLADRAMDRPRGDRRLTSYEVEVDAPLRKRDT